MRNFKEKIGGFIREHLPHKSDNRSNYIFFKIVGSYENKYSIQCINSNAFFYVTIHEMVEDPDILYFLHPIQSCYIGLEYASEIMESGQILEAKSNYLERLKQFPSTRYGEFRIFYQDRDGKIGFGNPKKRFIMSPREIAFNEDIIGQFDSIQAFYIGFLAGLKKNKFHSNDKSSIIPKLTLVNDRRKNDNKIH